MIFSIENMKKSDLSRYNILPHIFVILYPTAIYQNTAHLLHMRRTSNYMNELVGFLETEKYAIQILLPVFMYFGRGIACE